MVATPGGISEDQMRLRNAVDEDERDDERRYDRDWYARHSLLVGVIVDIHRVCFSSRVVVK